MKDAVADQELSGTFLHTGWSKGTSLFQNVMGLIPCKALGRANLPGKRMGAEAACQISYILKKEFSRRFGDPLDSVVGPDQKKGGIGLVGNLMRKEPIEVFLGDGQQYLQRKVADSEAISERSVAEREGFEPPLEFPPELISSQPPSASRPSLHREFFVREKSIKKTDEIQISLSIGRNILVFLQGCLFRGKSGGCGTGLFLDQK